MRIDWMHDLPPLTLMTIAVFIVLYLIESEGRAGVLKRRRSCVLVEVSLHVIRIRIPVWISCRSLSSLYTKMSS